MGKHTDDFISERTANLLQQIDNLNAVKETLTEDLEKNTSVIAELLEKQKTAIDEVQVLINHIALELTSDFAALTKAALTEKIYETKYNELAAQVQNAYSAMSTFQTFVGQGEQSTQPNLPKNSETLQEANPIAPIPTLDDSDSVDDFSSIELESDSTVIKEEDFKLDVDESIPKISGSEVSPEEYNAPTAKDLDLLQKLRRYSQ